MRALLSIHDVMPATLPAVSALLPQLHALVPALRPSDITLLVVPGADWKPAQLAWLRQRVQAGHPLAGHGWQHRASSSRSLWHHVHGLLLSRDAAEHLSRPEHEVMALVLRCHAWFARHDLPVGPLYVPPAWAAGCLSGQARVALPFALMETLSGVALLKTGQRRWLPLVGYEADTRWRAACLASSNALQWRWARAGGQPLRIGLHPFDLHWHLAGQLLQHLRQVSEFVDYAALLPATGVNAQAGDRASDPASAGR